MKQGLAWEEGIAEGAAVAAWRLPHGEEAFLLQDFSGGTIVEEGSIYAGVPAKKVKTISQELINGEIDRISNNYVKYASWFSEHNEAPATK